MSNQDNNNSDLDSVLQRLVGNAGVYLPGERPEEILNDIEKVVEEEFAKARKKGFIHPASLKKMGVTKIYDGDILDTCKFIGWAQNYPDQTTENSILQVASIYSKMHNGKAQFLEWGKKRTGFDQEKFEYIFNEALKLGSASCASINAEWSQCESCPKWGKIKTPHQITGASHIKTEKYGFFNVSFDKVGNPVRQNPNYVDLKRKFDEEFPSYVSLPEMKCIYVFNGKYYTEMNKDDIIAWTVQKLDLDNQRDSHRKEFVSFLFGFNKVGMNWFGESTNQKINLQNGVYDTKTNKLIPHSPQYGFKNVLPYDFESDAKCPNFDKFLNEVTLGDESLQRLLKEYIGYALSGDPIWLQFGMLLYGGGANGKSTLVQVIRELAGKGSYSSLMIDDLMDKESRYRLDGANFNICEELPRSVRSAENLKNIIGGGDVSAKKLYAQSYNFENRAKMFFTCNELPSTGDASYGLIRRFIIIPFNATFSDELKNIDRMILSKMKTELSGIFNQVIQAYIEVKKNSIFSESKASQAILKEFEEIQDTTMEFIQDRVHFNDELKIPRQTLYDKYKEFCESGGARAMTRAYFFKRLKLKYPNIEWDKEVREVDGGSRVRIIKGVGLKSTL